MNYSNNKKRFVEKEHYYLLTGELLKDFKDSINDIYVVGKNANQLYLWTERGASRHCKILDTDNAWKQFDKLEETYFNKKQEEAPSISNLSPQLQLLINMELKQAEIERKLEITTEKTEKVEQVLTVIQDTIIQRDDNWRDATNKMFNNAVQASGTKDYQGHRRDTYNKLEARGRCNLESRVNNMRARLAKQGATKTKIDSVSPLDVIEDVRLREIYTSIVKELAVKYASVKVSRV